MYNVITSAKENGFLGCLNITLKYWQHKKTHFYFFVL